MYRFPQSVNKNPSANGGYGLLEISNPIIPIVYQETWPNSSIHLFLADALICIST